MTPNTLTERLRGIIRVQVNDGAGLLGGKDFFERSFPTSNLAREAADRIEALEAALRRHAWHTSNCRHHGGHDCDCGLDEIRATLAPERDK
jgi:hypothetical protein